MKQKHADSPSAFLAAAMAVTGAAMLLCPLIGQNTEMNRSAAEYDDLRVQLKSEEQTADAPEKARKRRRQRTRLHRVKVPCAYCLVSKTQRKNRLNCPKRMNPRLKSTSGQAQTLRRVWHRTTISSRGSGFPARTWIIPSSGRMTRSITCITRSRGNRARRERCFR